MRISNIMTNMEGLESTMLKQLLDSTTQKGINLKKIYFAIANESGLTRADIVEKTNLKLSTCARLIEELIEDSLIEECGEAKSSGGRKAKKYAITPTENYIVGIDISRRHMKILLLQLDLKIIQEKRFEINASSTPDVVIQLIEQTINDMAENQGLHPSELLGIGVSTIGPLDLKNGVIINPRHFPAEGWQNVPLVRILENTFQVPVVIGYGQNTALYAEYRVGAVQESSNAVYINKGIGIRLGLMMNEEIIRAGDRAGKFGQGHMVVDVHGRECECGNFGCMNAYSTIPAIVEEVKRNLKVGKSSLLQEANDIETVTFQHIVEAYNLGDELCKNVLEETAFYSAAGLANLISLFQPEHVILSGPVYEYFDSFYTKSIEQATLRCEKILPDLHVVFSKGKLGENAAAIGAGSLLFNSLF